MRVGINYCDDFAFVCNLFVARKYRFFKFGEKGLVLPAADVSSCSARTRLLLVKALFIAVFVYAEPSFSRNFAGEVDREAVCVRELENVGAVKRFRARRICFFRKRVEKVHSRLDVCVKAIFFH